MSRLRLSLAAGQFVVLSLFGSVYAGGLLKTEALQVTSGPGNGVMFQELDPQDTGLSGFVNDYSSADVWGRRWREYTVGTIGTGIALGDVDGDGRPDLFVSSKDEESRLYRNLGDMRFEDITDASGFVDSPFPGTGCSFADVDDDGDLDLYVCYVRGGNQLWINDGKGRFEEKAEAWGVAVKSGSTMASFADYDRDGDLDLYLQNNLIADGNEFEKLSDQLFRNLGDRFEEVSAEAGIQGEGFGHSAVWWDFNGDGDPDVYVANDFATPDKLYRNNGDGTFTDVIETVATRTPYYSMGADFGDINNDGYPDYWVADMAPTSRSHYLRTLGSQSYLYDGRDRVPPFQYPYNAMLLNQGSEQLSDIAPMTGLAKTDWTWAARLVDLNNDGRLDAFATNGMLRSFHDGDLGMKQSRLGSGVRVYRNQTVLAERNLAFENLGDLQFERRGDEWGLEKLGVSFGVAFGDLDGDGDLDMALNNYQEPVAILRNDEAQHSRITISLRGTSSNSFGVGAKVVVKAGTLIQTKELYLMRGYMSTDDPKLHFGLGDAQSVDSIEIYWPSGVQQRFEVLSVNTHYTIEEEADVQSSLAQEEPTARFRKVEIDWPAEAARREARFADFKDHALLPYQESRLGGKVGLADFDLNGRIDLVLTGAKGQETTLLLNKGEGAFEYVYNLDFESDFGAEDWGVEIVDWNSDGLSDLIVASGGVESPEGDSFYEDRLYLNDGDGFFTRDYGAMFSELRRSSSVARAGDFDGDGDLDLFCGVRTIPGKFPLSESPSLWRNDGGSLIEITGEIGDGFKSPRRVSDAVWSDLEDDGDLDLVIAVEYGAIEVWRNEGGVLKRDRDALPQATATGFWNSLAVADLDGDGRKDILAGNQGLNTLRSDRAGGLATLWFRETEAGAVELFETQEEDGKNVFLNEKWRMEKAFPFSKFRAMNYEAYANASAESVFEDLEQSFTALRVTEPRNCVFWQDANGGFEKAALPRFAQVGRAMTVLLEDVDGDGVRDIVLSLEHLSPVPWSERFEGGEVVVLANQGGRRFRSWSERESGLEVAGSPRGLAWGDVLGDERFELVVTLSEGEPLVFTREDDSNAEDR